MPGQNRGRQAAPVFLADDGVMDSVTGIAGARITPRLRLASIQPIAFRSPPSPSGRTQPGGGTVIFRKDNRNESFQRQISNLRQQLQSKVSDEPNEQHEEESESAQPDEPQSPSWEERQVANRAPELLGTVSFPAAEVFGARPAWQDVDATTSVIASNAHWNGTFRSEGSLHIHGRADGELFANNDLYIAEGAKADAELFADNVVVAGVVRGRIEARSRLEVLPQGQVAGDVMAQRLVIHEGARLAGQLKMENLGGDATAAHSYRGRVSKSQHGGQ
jgi:cytoskeletal protein CcmA (bactofilin family)